MSVDEPPVPSSLPIMGHRLSASTSFVLAALRALHVDSCDAVTDAATIEEGTSPPLALQVGDTHGWSSLGSEAIETNRNREDQSPVRATTAFKRLIDLRGGSVTNVSFGPDQVVVTVRLRSRRLACPLCGFTTRARYDRRSVASSWRHLDLGRWRLQIRADLARLACPTHGVLTQGVPLARAGSRFTRDFEDLVGWLATTMDKTALRRLVRIDWDTTGRIIERVMVDGLDPRRLDNLFVIGVDEVSWRRGHSYVTLVSSHASGRFVWGKEGKDTATLDCFFDELGPERSEAIEAVSMDLGPAFDKSARKPGHATNAVICCDPFHVVALGTAALDKVRRQVWQELRHAPISPEADSTCRANISSSGTTLAT